MSHTSRPVIPSARFRTEWSYHDADALVLAMDP
jgi:hypothetical protein